MLEKVNLCGNCVIYIRCSLCILNHLHTVKGVLLINQKHLFKTYCEKHTKPKTWKKWNKNRDKHGDYLAAGYQTFLEFFEQQ